MYVCAPVFDSALCVLKQPPSGVDSVRPLLTLVPSHTFKVACSCFNKIATPITDAGEFVPQRLPLPRLLQPLPKTVHLLLRQILQPSSGRQDQRRTQRRLTHAHLEGDAFEQLLFLTVNVDKNLVSCHCLSSLSEQDIDQC